MQMVGTLNVGRTPEVLESLSVPITQSVVGMVASTGVGGEHRAGRLPPPGGDRGGRGRHAGDDSRRRCLIGGRLAGVVSAINPRGGGLFSAEDLERLSFNAYLLGLILADTHGL